MKKAKKLIALVIATACLFSSAISVSALSMVDGVDTLKSQFVMAEGPVENGYSIDYRYYSPVKENDTNKYPLVVWLHGMGDGAAEGDQVRKSNIAYWTSDEFQSRFGDVDGAYILAARSREELGMTWTNEMIEPLRAAINEFVLINEANIDISRIYIGGYSMGGKMTLKMTIAYPEMFAAAFPICPAWSPEDSLTAHLSDMPVWLTSGFNDPLVNYAVSVEPTWNSIIKQSNVAEECRFSTLSKVCYEDGTACSSNHHAWFAINHDMFSSSNGDYPYMTTVNGKGEEVTLTYPDGMISWLYSHTSDYDGSVIEGTGNITENDSTDNLVSVKSIVDLIKAFLQFIVNIITGKI